MMLVDFFVGVIIAALAGIGVGGGGLLVLYLIFVKGIGQLEAQGTNLLFFIAASSASLLYHVRKRKIDYRACFILSIAGVVGAVIGAVTAYRVNPDVVRKIFGWLLVTSGAISILGKKRKK